MAGLWEGGRVAVGGSCRGFRFLARYRGHGWTADGLGWSAGTTGMGSDQVQEIGIGETDPVYWLQTCLYAKRRMEDRTAAWYGKA